LPNKDSLPVGPMLFIFLVGLLSVWFALPQKPKPELTTLPTTFVSEESILPSSEPALGFLPLGQRYVALNQQGGFTQSLPRSEVLSSHSLGLMTNQGQGIQLHTLGSGVLSYSLDNPEGVYWNGQSLFQFQDFGFTLAALGLSNGETLWQRSFTSPITALSQGTDLLAVGELGGKIHLLGPDGQEEAIVTPTGSQESVIYNLALSAAGDKLISISGVCPKRFFYWERQGNELRAFYDRTLQDVGLSPSYLAFSKDETMALYQDRNDLVIYHIADDTLQVLPVEGEVHSVQIDPITQNFIVLQKTNEGGRIDFYTSGADLLSRSAFRGDLKGALWAKGRVLLSLGDRIQILSWDQGLNEKKKKNGGDDA
jgi:hypothetical protein